MTEAEALKAIAAAEKILGKLTDAERLRLAQLELRATKAERDGLRKRNRNYRMSLKQLQRAYDARLRLSLENAKLKDQVKLLMYEMNGMRKAAVSTPEVHRGRSIASLDAEF